MTQVNNEQKKGQAEHKELEEALAKALEADQQISWYDRETLSINGVHYKIVNNFRDGFDIEQFKERYIDYLDSFDYIVGDIASEKLRLRGFYDENRKQVREDQWITRVDDYLIEYCNFGAPYFILERIDKLEEIPMRKSEGDRGNKQKNRRRSRKHHSRRQNQKRQRKQNRHSFKKEIRQIQEGDKLKKEVKKSPKNTPPKKRFKIRPVNEK